MKFDKYERKGAYHWAEYYGGLLAMNAYTRARYDLVAESVRDCASQLANPSTARVLDLGCGDGALASVLHRTLRVPISGLDTNPTGIGLARTQFSTRNLPGEFRTIAGYDTGVPPGSFDIVVCSEVIEHVDDPERLLREIKRVLAVDGFAIVTTPIRISEAPMDPLHVREWFVGEFVALCEGVLGPAAKIVRSHPLVWYELVTAKRLWTNRAARLTANVLTMAGRNPFGQADRHWRSYTTQMIVLRNSRRE